MIHRRINTSIIKIAHDDALAIANVLSVGIGIYALSYYTYSFSIAALFIWLVSASAGRVPLSLDEWLYARYFLKHWQRPLSKRFAQIGRHCTQDGVISVVTYTCVGLCLTIDSNGNMETQNALGICAWSILATLLLKENFHVRMQVAIAIAFATVGEHFASPYMGGYTYRFENVPAYIPPGHGMVYLTAVAMARTRCFKLYRTSITRFVLIAGSLWAIWGVTLAEQGDWVGFWLFCIFVVSIFIGRSPLVYLAAFFITTYLELVGTYYGTWRWAAIDPVLSLPQGNPPCGVAAWYCMVDAAALAGAPKLVEILTHGYEALKRKWTEPLQRTIGH